MVSMREIHYFQILNTKLINRLYNSTCFPSLFVICRSSGVSSWFSLRFYHYCPGIFFCWKKESSCVNLQLFVFCGSQILMTLEDYFQHLSFSFFTLIISIPSREYLILLFGSRACLLILPFRWDIFSWYFSAIWWDFQHIRTSSWLKNH